MAVAIFLASSASASGPCEADVQSLCPGVPPGTGLVLACLRAQLPLLSPSCQPLVAGFADELLNLRDACVPILKPESGESPSEPSTLLAKSIQSGNPEAILNVIATEAAAITSDACRAAVGRFTAHVMAIAQQIALAFGAK